MRGIIVRALGVANTVTVDFVSGRYQQGDIFLLCSDGLVMGVGDRKLKQLLTQPTNLRCRTASLVEAAKSGGSDDDITVALCEVT
jgi:PPM family protein phosphatase